MSAYTTAASRLSTDYLLLAQRLQDLKIAEATSTGDFTIIQPATPPTSPISPKPIQSAAVGFGVGLFAGIVLAFVVGQFDTRVRTHTQAGEILGLSVVGRVPHLGRRLLRDETLVTLTDPGGSVAEAVRVLRSNLDWKSIDDGWKSLLITSSLKGEGKTLTLCNLAVTLALAGKKVVVVDADLRDPQVHKAFSMPNETGLTTVIQGTLSLATAVRPFDLEKSNGSDGVAAPGVLVSPRRAAGIRERRFASPHVGAAATQSRGGHRFEKAGGDAETAGQVRGRLRPRRRASSSRCRRHGSARPRRRRSPLRGQSRQDSTHDSRGRARGPRRAALPQAGGRRRRRAPRLGALLPPRVRPASGSLIRLRSAPACGGTGRRRPLVGWSFRTTSSASGAGRRHTRWGDVASVAGHAPRLSRERPRAPRSPPRGRPPRR